MTRFAQIVLIVFVGGSFSARLLGQNQQNSADFERVRAEERARQEAEQRDWETKIFPVKFVDPNELRAALSMFRSSINYSGGSLRVLSVRAPKEIMPAIEDAIKRLDVPMPRKDAELTIHVLLASDQVGAAPLPAALQPVVNQLKNVLQYKGYQLVDTLIARGRDSNNPMAATTLQGTLPMDKPAEVTYNFHATFHIMNPDGKEAVLRLDNMQFVLAVRDPQRGGQTNLQINTDVEIPRGQQVVVGKATYNDRAFILVMNSKFD